MACPSAVSPSDDFLCERKRLELQRATAHIMIVDDEELNLRVVGQILARAGYERVTPVSDPREVATIAGDVPPDLVILDLHMPGYDGFAVLADLTDLVHREHVPVLVVTGDSSSSACRQALEAGARDFIAKPVDATELTLRVGHHLETRLLYRDLAKQHRGLRAAFVGRGRALESARLETVKRIAIVAEYRDDGTARHNERVGRLAGLLARRVGFAARESRILAKAATLHDVGKIGVPDALLRKAGPLSPAEIAVMRTHTDIGARILGGSTIDVLRVAATIALTHHERWDGAGYPRGIAGTDIPLAGRIVAVADAYDAITSDRPYRARASRADALQRIWGERGRQFDPAIVDALLASEIRPDARIADGLYLAEPLAS